MSGLHALERLLGTQLDNMAQVALNDPLEQRERIRVRLIENGLDLTWVTRAQPLHRWERCHDLLHQRKVLVGRR